MRKTAIIILLAVLTSFTSIPLLPVAHATTVTSYLTNYGNCSSNPLVADSQNSGLANSYYVFGTWTGTAASRAGCNGVGYIGAQMTGAGFVSTVSDFANAWFIDTFTVQNLGQDYSQLKINGTIFLLGWLGATGSGVAYFKADSALSVHFKVLDSSGLIKDDFA